MINLIKASKDLDCRKKETIRVDILFDSQHVFAIAPNGTSKSKKEVRDYSAKGLSYSIELINKIGKEIIEKKIKIEKFEDLEAIEEIIRKYDNTKDFRVIGGNAVYALEAALIKAYAKINNIEVWSFIKGKVNLPTPIGNCIGGGKHVGYSDFQEFLIIPRTKKFFEAYFIMKHTYEKAREELEKRKKLKGTNIENALIANLSNEETLDFLMEIKDKVKEMFNSSVDVGIDVAASNFYENRVYKYKNPIKNLTASKQLKFVQELIDKYKLAYVEDPFYEEDFESFRYLSKKDCLVVGDDLTATNPEIIERAAKMNCINGVIIKPNQVGSLLVMKAAIDIAKKYGIVPIISHRSGEVEDDFIADLAVGFGFPYIKTGIIGKEREIKLRRIVAIEKSLQKCF
jgi:enolase